MNKREYALKLAVWLTFVLMIALVLPGCGSRHDDAEMWRDEAATNYAILHGRDYPSVDDYEAVDKAAGRKEDEDIVFHWREYKEIRDQIAEMIDGGTGTTAAEPSAEPEQPGPLSLKDVVGTYHITMDYFFMSPSLTLDAGEGTVTSDGEDMLTVSVPAYGKDGLKLYAKTYSGRFVSIDADNAKLEVMKCTSNGKTSSPSAEGYSVEILFTRNALKIRLISNEDGNGDIQIESGVKVN
jgi:hypothetical protein